jgi:hypothetical protein
MNERQIVAEAWKRSHPAERAAYLDGACAGDPSLRARLETLVQVQPNDPGIRSEKGTK